MDLQAYGQVLVREVCRYGGRGEVQLRGNYRVGRVGETGPPAAEHVFVGGCGELDVRKDHQAQVKLYESALHGAHEILAGADLVHAADARLRVGGEEGVHVPAGAGEV